jgi:oxygen-independent coproporphyrinogen-3 oxidase
MNDLSVYVHIPFCARKCRYCSFYSVPPETQLLPSFFRAVSAELDLYNINLPVETLYLGGGSPSLLKAEHLIPFLRELKNRTGPVFEWTVEINPAQADQKLLAQLKALGVNRLSFGAQSFRQKDLDFLGRLPRADDIGRSVNLARVAGFDNIGLDLIYAIPGSSLKTWKQTLQKAVDLNVQHISAYSLTFEKGTPLYQDLQSGKVTPVDEDTDRAMYDTAIGLLTAAGFEHYEISNFARPGFACRHNLRYWNNRPWIGLGPSAASWFSGRRTTNIADLQKYIAAIENGEFAWDEIQTPSQIQSACETVVLNLRKTAGISRRVFREQTGFDPLELFAEPVAKYTALGLLTADSDTIRLTPAALPIADSILCDFAEI